MIEFSKNMSPISAMNSKNSLSAAYCNSYMTWEVVRRMRCLLHVDKGFVNVTTRECKLNRLSRLLFTAAFLCKVHTDATARQFYRPSVELISVACSMSITEGLGREAYLLFLFHWDNRWVRRLSSFSILLWIQASPIANSCSNASWLALFYGFSIVLWIISPLLNIAI